MLRKECNFRDLGSIPGSRGRLIRTGLFYRSCCPARMNHEELQEVSSLGIKTVLDLRTSYEAYEEEDPRIGEAEYFRVSGMRDKLGDGIDYSPEGIHRLQQQVDNTRLNSYMQKIYIDMMFDNQAFKFLLLRMEEEKLPVLFHCATGKDRTGAVAMILLLTLGVSQEDILLDFMASNDSFREKIDQDLQIHHVEIVSEPSLRNKILAQDGVLLQNGKDMLQEILTRYDSFEHYLYQEYGLDQVELEKIRQRYLIA